MKRLDQRSDSWPEDLADAFGKATSVLAADQVDISAITCIAEALERRADALGSLRRACDDEADLLARQLGSPGRDSYRYLTAEGWVIHDYGAIRTWHVHAVSALMWVWRFDAQPGSLDALLDAIHFANEAVFMAGREGMKAHILAAELERRRAAGKKGGSPPKYPDDEIIRFRDQFRRIHKTDRGASTWIAKQLLADPESIRLRLKKLPA